MEYEVLYRPSYSVARLKLAAGEAVAAESGAMVSMSGGIQLETSTRGGIFGALKRSVLGGESFFMNTFTAQGTPGELLLAPSLPGDIVCHVLQGRSLMIQSGSYLASHPGVDIDTKWGGAKTFFSREGLFLLKASGAGYVFVSSYGAVHQVSLAAGERYIVDTGHMVAFDETVQYSVRSVGGLKSTFFSGEGLVCELTGPGTIYLQTRSEDAFLSWLLPRIPKSGS
ncbi:MAG: TIGR00266 family protein [Planctomycetes bacterium]|nr:TIGR00266 family protein [Planctomycetota bacterium]